MTEIEHNKEGSEEGGKVPFIDLGGIALIILH